MKFKSEKVLLWAVVAALVLIGVVLLAYWVSFPFKLSTDQAIWGQFGDYFGGILNPLLSFFALFGLFLTVRSQQEEARKAGERHEEQIFDTRLFQLLSLSHDAVASIKYVGPVSLGDPPVYEGHRAVAYALNRLQEDYLYRANRKAPELMYAELAPKYSDWERSYWTGVASYIESMLFVIWYVIDNSIGKKRFVFALRAVLAQMSSDEKLLLFYVMIFSSTQKLMFVRELEAEFAKGASSDDLLFCRAALLHSAALARLTPTK